MDIDVGKEPINVKLHKNSKVATCQRCFYIYCIYYLQIKCLFFNFGILGNACGIIYNVFFNRSKTSTTYFVVNLAINDVLACSIIYQFGLQNSYEAFWELQITRRGFILFIKSIQYGYHFLY